MGVSVPVFFRDRPGGHDGSSQTGRYFTCSADLDHKVTVTWRREWLRRAVDAEGVRMLDIPGLICEADAQSLTRLVQSVFNSPGMPIGGPVAILACPPRRSWPRHYPEGSALPGPLPCIRRWKENVSTCHRKGVLVDTVKGTSWIRSKLGPMVHCFRIYRSQSQA